MPRPALLGRGGGVLAWFRPASRSGRRFLIVVAAAYALARLFVLPYGLSRLLVVGYHQFPIPKGRVAIVVLDARIDFVENGNGQR